MNPHQFVDEVIARAVIGDDLRVVETFERGFLGATIYRPDGASAFVLIDDGEHRWLSDLAEADREPFVGKFAAQLGEAAAGLVDSRDEE